MPDISALADPFTGFALFLTEDGTTFFEAGVGGTSLASPIFKAIWAIADQYHGSPLGSAAPLVAALNSGQITDVLPTSPFTDYDVTASITDPNGTTSYPSTTLFTGLLLQHDRLCETRSGLRTALLLSPSALDSTAR